MRKPKLGTIVCAIALASAALGAHAGQDAKTKKESALPPALVSKDSAAICTKKAGKTSCVNAILPKSLGVASGVVEFDRIKNSTASWILVTDKDLAICGVNFSTKAGACSTVPGLRAKIIEASQDRRGSNGSVFLQHKHAVDAAALRVSKKLGEKPADDKGGMVTPYLLEPTCPDCDNDDDPGIGGADPRNEVDPNIPIVEIVGDAPDPSPAPPPEPGIDLPPYEPPPTNDPIPVSDPLPGAAWWESLPRQICMNTAYKAFMAEDRVYKSIRNLAARGECNTWNWIEYNKEREQCEERYPE